jgi:hypothetical protein
MPIGTLASLWIGAALAVAVLLGVGVSGGASAGAYKCEDRFLDDIDEMQLRAAALRVLPKSTHLDAVNPCRNPDSAHARISTKRVASIEGVQQWYELTCLREARSWRCDPPESNKAFQTRLVLEGSSHEVNLAFNGEMSLDRALKLANVALKAYQPSAALLFCGDKESNQADTKDLWSHSPMPAGKVTIQISADTGSATETVWLTDAGVTMDFAIQPNQEIEPIATCWNVEVIVA